MIGPVTAPLDSAGLADCIGDAVVVYGPDRKVTLWNRAAERLFGLPAFAALGADAGSLIGHVDPPPPPDGGAVRTRWTDQLLMVRPDGDELHVERQFTLPSVGGRPSGETVLVLTSLDDRRKSDAVARQFTAILDSSSEAILSKTRTGTIATWNRAAERMYGYSTEEVIGRHVSILVPADRRGELQEILDRVSAGASTERLETVRLRKDGSQARVVLSVSPLTDETGLVVGAVTVADDLTGKRATEAELVLAELRFDGAFATSVFGMAMADLVGRITAVNSAMSDLLGREAREIVGHTLSDFAEDADGQCDPPVPRGGPDSYSDERRYRRSDGAIVWLQTNVTLIRDAVSNPLHAMLQVLDITARKQLEHELEHRALHDDLTGLANRALLNDRLEHLLVATERTGRQVGVAFLDVDGFKYVNDALGHAAGDRLLVELGRRLGRAVRPEDTVARFGGDEFVILCSDVTIANMEVLAERVGAAMSQRFAVDSESVSMHLSIGITVGTPTSTAQSLLSEADAAMFRAKELGRGRVATFDDTMRMRAADYLQGEASLRSALGNHELVAHYQPIVNLNDGRVVGVEALARWEHATGVVVPPSQFIPLAESTGLIHRLGELMLLESTAVVAAWNSGAGPDDQLWVSVNLSTRQLAGTHLVDLVRRALSESGLAAGSLHLEVTESVLMDDVGGSIDLLRELHDMGVRISIDDFGTGYSSLAYLKRLPVDTIKIDQTFVDGLSTDASDRSIVRAVVGLSRAMGLDCLAEGVERQDQLDALVELGCDLGQGYLWSVPLPAPEAQRWIAGRLPAR